MRRSVMKSKKSPGKRELWLSPEVICFVLSSLNDCTCSQVAELKVSYLKFMKNMKKALFDTLWVPYDS